MKKLLLIALFLSGLMGNAQNYNPIINYEFNGTPTKGIKIKTNIPYANGYQMPTLIIEGYQYGGKRTIGLLLNWYIYNSNFYNPTLSSHGGYTPEIKLYNENGKVVVFINDKQYYNRFSIRGYSGGLRLTDAHFQNWSISDELPTGTNEVLVPYRNKFAGDVEFTNGIWDKDGNVGIGTTTPKEKLHIAGSLRGNLGGGALRVKTDHGYLDLGAQNTEWAHIYTDRKAVIFNKDVYTTTNAFSSYNNSLLFKVRGTEKLRIENNGNVGIGTTTPKEKLHIAGSLRGNLGGGALRVKTDHGYLDLGAQNTEWAHIYTDRKAVIFNKDVYTTTNSFSSYNNSLLFKVKGTERLRIEDNGNVGIGTSNTKGFKLGVNGRIAATEVKVAKYEHWADFVFEDDYALPTLKEVEKHIEEKGHLENIPSAEEVKKDGFFLGEMDAKLLRKIEELTLYTIQQEKELKKASSNNEKLLSIIEKLEKRIEKLESK
ncbi:DUF4200 domain-containing protein [Tenacibaculum sp. M341]|uniref:DUF4200 domain-containing protein n=1 Tax=Tenacibaculum sp. M341 TaxID=2530339 RepID=UPI001052ECA3|nr:DUF4200 domain-containing protein [Tenacibaculum sp. M341]TCI90159.1 hypothetical protein EYW44_14595 [Tenacibaculum sp. M341]